MNDVTRVTGGSVMFEDATKIDVGGDPQYWPTRRARVELTFVVAPDEADAEGYLSKVQASARARTAEMLGTTSATALTNTARVGETEAQTATRTRRTKAQIAEDKAAEEAAKSASNAGSGSEAPSGGASGGGETSADPFEAGAAPAAETPAPATADEWDTPATPAAPEVTDADLGAACSKRNAVLKDPDKIRGLINTYNPDPNKVFQLREIPQDKRADFLAKLEVLK